MLFEEMCRIVDQLIVDRDVLLGLQLLDQLGHGALGNDLVTGTLNNEAG